MKRIRSWLFIAAIAWAPRAHADSLSAIEGKLASDESSAASLGKDIPHPDKPIGGGAELSRRVTDAEVSFSLGRYDDTATLLYDVVSQGRGAKDYDTAVYYMAEAMYQKGDKGAARTYFAQLITDAPGSSYYQPSLERLIELSLELHDSTGVDEYLADLDQIPAGDRAASVPYVRGKYAFSLGHYDEAEKWFAEVSADSEYGFQAQYLTGTTYVAQKDLGKASDTFAALIDRAPKRPADRRVIELAELALGRLYYERDQPSKAIDSYLMIDRKSDLFDDALYEVAWVYVKGKQFDKALRALELLSLSDPGSQKLPTVKLLEGNLRIRKAQTVHQQQIEGLFTGKDDPEAEYTKADTIFTTTRDTYKSAHEALTRVIADNDDPATYLAQITNRNTKTFQVNATLPEVAAQWLREQPDVERIVQVEDDLGDIQDNIDAAARYVERLDQVLAAPDKTSAFPALAERRSRLAEVRADVVKQLGALADAEYDLASKAGGDAAELQGAHIALGKAQEAFNDIPAQRAQALEQVTELRNQLDALDQQLSESQVVMNSVEATGAAIRKYMADEGAAISPQLEESVEQSLGQLGPEVDSIQTEADDIRREITLARDATAPGDPVAAQEKAARTALLAAIDEQHQAAARILGSASGDEQKIGTLTAQARRVAQMLDASDAEIDQSAITALANVSAELAKQKADLASYQTEFTADETESKSLGGTVLGQSFRDVKSKFYDVIVRADVGVIDVSWSRREESEDELKRLTLEKQREAKQIRDEFRGVLDDQSSQPAPAPSPQPAPTTSGGGGQ
jgi:hypothetical protein